jgi:hypothetical protein
MVALVLVLALSSPARAQSTCEIVTFEGGDEASTERYRFDASGLRAQTDSYSRAVMWETRQIFRYRRGVLVEERLRTFEGPIDSEIGWAPRMRFRYSEHAQSVTVTREGGWPRQAGTDVWTFDERGLPTSVVSRPGSESDEEDWRCTYDIEGRPVYAALRQDGSEVREREFVWDDGRLVRIEVSWRDGSETLRVVERGADVFEVVGPDGAVQARWTGSCGAVVFDHCSPALAPLPPSGATGAQTPSRAPAADLRAPPPRAAAGPASAFPASIPSGVLTLDRVRDAFSSFHVWTDVTFGENDPSFAIPIVCVGARGGACATVIHTDGGRASRAYTTDPTMPGPSGVRAGARHRSVDARLTECAMVQGLDEGVRCAIRGEPSTSVWFEVRGRLVDGHPPPPAMLARARVSRLEWSAPSP